MKEKIEKVVLDVVILFEKLKEEIIVYIVSVKIIVVLFCEIIKVYGKELCVKGFCKCKNVEIDVSVVVELKFEKIFEI